jgi:hypothetical protein
MKPKDIAGKQLCRHTVNLTMSILDSSYRAIQVPSFQCSLDPVPIKDRQLCAEPCIEADMSGCPNWNAYLSELTRPL